MKKIFIAATKQNDGKTTVALGLISNLRSRFKNIGFIKPVGQRYLQEEGFKIDEDSVLIERVLKICGIKCHIKDMSPVAVERGFTERYIVSPKPQDITRQIQQSFRRISRGKDLMVIEGTGHAGVGSVFDHSNAQVAKFLRAKVVLISSGGIGRPIDEIVLNKALFDKIGIRLMGVIINKVMPEKFDKVSELVRSGLKRVGVEVLGVIPYDPILSYPTIKQIMEETDFQLLTRADCSCLDNRVARVVVGAMQPKDAAKYFIDQSLLITPGDREDIISLALESHAQGRKISGIVLSGDLLPAQETVDKVKAAAIPVLLSKQDTYSVASLIHDLIIKIRPSDKDKIEIAKKLIKDYVSLDRIMKKL